MAERARVRVEDQLCGKRGLCPSKNERTRPSADLPLDMRLGEVSKQSESVGS